MKTRGLRVLVAVGCSVVLAGCLTGGELATGKGFPEKVDWDGAKEFAPGMKIVNYTFDEPREMAAWIVRVDLKTPKLRATGTGKAANFGQPMPDVTNRVVKIETKREPTRSFLEGYRKNGTNMVLAANTAPWGPWEKPFNHKYARIEGFALSRGEIVSDCRFGWPMIVIRNDGTAAVTNRIDREHPERYAVAHPGFGTVLRGGQIIPKPPKPGDKPATLAPRTAYGVSADGHVLYVLVVDGRQPGYSMGADMLDLARLLKAAGAADGINVDGGGSTTLVRVEDGKVVTDNHHQTKGFYRSVAMSLGFYYEK